MGDAVTVVRVQRNGPLVATGALVIATRAGPRRLATAVLCRCGASTNKPFCDGSHVRRGFVDDARLPDRQDAPPTFAVASPAGPARVAPLAITPMLHGPLRCVGPFAVRDAGGRMEAARSPKLCRCGASLTKPYCDGSHRGLGLRNGSAA